MARRVIGPAGSFGSHGRWRCDALLSVSAGIDIYRERTAISRLTISLPARTALLNNVITADTTVLDYGCGRGDDVRRLTALRIGCQGWDPHYRPKPPPAPADIVLCTYVVNAIEDQAERDAVVRHAWELAGRCLILSARTPADTNRLNGEHLGDGVITQRGTFQRAYTTPELAEWAGGLIGERGLPAVPGVLYFFRDRTERLTFLARRHAARTKASPDSNDLVRLTSWFETHGRPPNPEEDPAAAAVSRDGGLAIARREADPALVAAATARRKVDLLVVLAIEAFHGQRRMSDLPPALAADLRAFYPNFVTACRRADWLLWAVGDADTRRRAALGSRLGKLTPTALYVHMRAEAALPAVLRVYAVCGELVSGRPAEANLVKLHHHQAAVSFLTYPDFDRDAHPRLAESLTVDLQRLRTDWRDWAGQANRPLLHRKEEFLTSDDPRAALYRKLTRREVAAGLYTRPALIGREDGWQRVLDEAGYKVQGHKIVRTGR